jgi:hypothetical protein
VPWLFIPFLSSSSIDVYQHLQTCHSYPTIADIINIISSYHCLLHCFTTWAHSFLHAHFIPHCVKPCPSKMLTHGHCTPVSGPSGVTAYCSKPFIHISILDVPLFHHWSRLPVNAAMMDTCFSFL